jgi:hypothetical protein
VPPLARWPALRQAATLAALFGSGLLALSQLVAYVLGVWLAGAAF